jgi:hypothetical protein
MPSFSHEAIVFLFREAPRLALALLERVTGWRPPGPVRIALTDISAGQLQPTERRADAAFVLTDEHGAACAAIILEVQRDRDEDKRIRWPEYVAVTQARLRVPCYLLVVTLDPAVAAWARRPVEFGRPGYGFAPVVIGPAELPVHVGKQALEDLPELGLLVAQANVRSEGVVDLVQGLLGRIRGLSKRQRLIYWDMLLITLGPVARRLVEAEMPEGYQFQNEFARRSYDLGHTEGHTEGLKDGRTETLREVAGRLLGEGMAPADVARVTGLALAEVQALVH